MNGERSVRGKVVLITGPARGIGAATARALAQRGATLSLVGMEPALLKALAAELGPSHVWFECDVTDQTALDRAVEGTVHALGRIDVVVANAGIASNGTVRVADVEALVRVLNVNLVGVLRTAKAALPQLLETRGYLLLVASAAAFSAMPGLSAYAASKAGVEQLANVMRLELLPHGVAVGTAYMTWINTDLVRDVQTDVSAFNRTLAKLPGPFGRVTSLEQCTTAFVRAIESRARTVFVPGSLARLSAIRQLLSSAFAQRFTKTAMIPLVLETERDMAQLGRSFGEKSVGMGGTQATE